MLKQMIFSASILSDADKVILHYLYLIPLIPKSILKSRNLLYGALPYVTNLLLPFGLLRLMLCLLVCMAVRFGAQGFCAKVMCLNLTSSSLHLTAFSL